MTNKKNDKQPILSDTDIAQIIQLDSISKKTAERYDKVISESNIGDYCAVRCAGVATKLEANKVSVVMFENCEERPDPAIRYLTGFPGDGLLLLSPTDSILIPWDENLAEQYAHVDKIIPYTKFGRNNVKAVSTILHEIEADDKPVIEIEPCTPYPLFLKYLDALEDWDVRCKETGIHAFVSELREKKDHYEIACTRKACAITSHLTDLIEKKVKSGSLKTETDVALFIEKELRAFDCERTGFDTLAAGPSRSFAIHAFPGYTSGTWGDSGLSILDYGVVYNGYTSDATITVARGPLSAKQKELLTLVQQAADEALPLYKDGASILAAQNKADAIFAKAKRTMPHSLGHGIGLEIHEAPFVSKRAPVEAKFKQGNIVTLEPGLYDPELGGVRLENDVLICEDGNVLLTNSRIITL
jgi:Xaa-Pro dipeptidase